MPCSIALKMVTKEGLELLDKTRGRQKAEGRPPMETWWAEQMSLGKKISGVQAAASRVRGHKEGKERKRRVLCWQEGAIRGHKWKQWLKGRKKKCMHSLGGHEWDLSRGDAASRIMSSDNTEKHPAYTKFICPWESTKTSAGPTDPFQDPPLFTVSRNSGTHPVEVIPYRRRVSSVSKRAAKHLEVDSSTHSLIFTGIIQIRKKVTSSNQAG